MKKTVSLLLFLLWLCAPVWVGAADTAKKDKEDAVVWGEMPAGAKTAYIGIHGGTVPVSLLSAGDGSPMIAMVGLTGNDFLNFMRNNGKLREEPVLPEFPAPQFSPEPVLKTPELLSSGVTPAVQNHEAVVLSAEHGIGSGTIPAVSGLPATNPSQTPASTPALGTPPQAELPAPGAPSANATSPARPQSFSETASPVAVSPVQAKSSTVSMPPESPQVPQDGVSVPSASSSSPDAQLTDLATPSAPHAPVAPAPGVNATLLLAGTADGDIPVIYATGRAFERMSLIPENWAPFGLTEKALSLEGEIKILAAPKKMPRKKAGRK